MTVLVRLSNLGPNPPTKYDIAAIDRQIEHHIAQIDRLQMQLSDHWIALQNLLTFRRTHT